MEVRLALCEEIPYLQARLRETDGEQVDLWSARIWVVVEDGRIEGMLAARLCWQIEPLLVFPECGPEMRRRRAGFALYRAAMAWMESGENRTGVRWFFAVTRATAVEHWLKKLGWLRQYVGAMTLVKYL